MNKDPVVIIGGGLTGLAAARALRQAGAPFVLLEGEARVGGLCRTEQVGNYLFDHAGHLLHLRPGKVRALLLSLLGNDVVEHSRRATVQAEGVFVPYPIQAAFGALGRERAQAILESYRAAAALPEGEIPSFLRWAEANFGAELVRLFFAPYNRKLFVHPLEELLPTWTSWSVPRPTPQQMERAAAGADPAACFGYNSTFFYPRAGGIELLPQRLAEGLGGSVRTSQQVVGVDVRARTVTVRHRPLEPGRPGEAGEEDADGTQRRERIRYSRLISTAPLPELLGMAAGLDPSLAAAAARLRWSSVLCLCLGTRGFTPRSEHWIYIPEEDAPYHRVGVPGNYSRRTGPAGAVSFSVEVAFDPRTPPDLKRLARAAREHFLRSGLLPMRAGLETEGSIVLPYGYVFHDRWREDHLPLILDALRREGVDSVGRYGAWEYSSMQDAVEQGLVAGKRALQ